MTQKKTLGLALGGGSARGFAHIGVIKALLQHGIEISCIAGCSMGSLIGGIFACDGSLEALINLAKVFDYKKYEDLSFSLMGYMKGEKVEKLLALMTKNQLIEKSKIPFCCVATNLAEGKLTRFTSGPFAQRIRASISLPGIFTPKEIDGNLYVDGGVIDRTAIDAAWAMKPDKVLAVDVGYRGTENAKIDNVLDVIEVSFAISDWYRAKGQLSKASICIMPDLEGISGSEYTGIPKIVERGEQACLEALSKIKEMLEVTES